MERSFLKHFVQYNRSLVFKYQRNLYFFPENQHFKNTLIDYAHHRKVGNLPLLSKLAIHPSSIHWTVPQVIYHILVGFGRACAPVRCADPSFWAHCNAPAPAPAHRSFAATPEIKKIDLFPETKCFPSGPNWGRQGRIFSTGLSCTLLSYMASYWATLHTFELRCPLLSYAAPYWASLHPTKLCCIQLSYAAPNLS